MATSLNVVKNGASLIKNGVIQDVGPSRRVENLAGARKAREIDATGKLVMPAFVDADMSLVIPSPIERQVDSSARDFASALRIMSRKRVLAGATETASEWARYGCLTVGAHTGSAADLKNVGKVLRTHQALQSKPLRIRSIFSPVIPSDGGKSQAASVETVISKWLPAVRTKKLASVIELTVGRRDSTGENPVDSDPAIENPLLRTLAVAAAGLGYAIRLYSATRLEPFHLQLALSAGAIAIVAPNDSLRAFTGPLGAIGCVRVIPATEGLEDGASSAPEIRRAIGDGAAIAISSTCRSSGPLSFNMQYLLYLAVHRLGLTAEEAIIATTWNPACSLRLSHVSSSLEPGKAADLLVMDVPDYHELPRRAGHHDASLVMRKGQVVFRSTPLILD
jgi:imidazolonepropionase